MNPAYPAHVAIVGGGIAGLATAYRVQQLAQEAGLPLRLTLIEERSCLGGKIVTERRDDFVIEGGPDSFITQKPAALALCRELGLTERLMGTNDALKEVFVLDHGRLKPLPEGVLLVVPTRFLPFALSPLISPWGKLRMGLDLVIPPAPPGEDSNGSSDESLARFVRRRLGREALEKIAEPLMAGIHVADPERLSLQATFPRFAEIERKYGSLIRGMLAARKQRSLAPRGGERKRRGSSPPSAKVKTTMFMSLRGGLMELVETLAARIDGASIRTQRSVTRLTYLPAGSSQGPGSTPSPPAQLPSGSWQLTLNDGETLTADAVVLAIPAFAAADLLADWEPSLASALRTIRYVTTATVSLAYRREEFNHPMNGFGFVVPTPENRRILACTWTSTKFPHRSPPDRLLLRCFIGGARNEALAEQDEADLTMMARDELQAIMGVTAEPVLTQVYRWPQGNPQYDVGHLDRVAKMEAMASRYTGLFLTGSAFRGIGLPDCIAQGEATARKIIAHIQAGATSARLSA